MNFQEFILKCCENHRLISLMLELNFSCQYKCPFCYNERNRKGKKLNLEKYEELLKDAKEEGGLFLTLTGGEPTLNKLFFNVCKIANNLSYSIRIKSNGYKWDKNFIKKLKEEVNPFNIDLSIYGAREDTYEKISGVEGSFRSFLDTIENLKKENFRIRFKLPLNSINENEVEEIFDLAKKFEIEIDPFADLSINDSGELFPLNFIASDKGIEKMYENLFNFSLDKNNSFISTEELDKENIDSAYVCGAGVMSLTIDPFGEVYPCVAWRKSLGNLWEKDLKEIWSSREIKEILKISKIAKKRKDKCKILKNELFCPGIAYSQFKNPLTIYPRCVKISKVKKNILEDLKKKEKKYERKKEI